MEKTCRRKASLDLSKQKDIDLLVHIEVGKTTLRSEEWKELHPETSYP